MAKSEAEEKRDEEHAAGIGHNQAFSKKRLKEFLKRYDRLLDDMMNLKEDEKHLGIEVKNAGLVFKTLKIIAKEARMDKEDRDIHYEMLSMYREGAGLLAGTPLGDAAEESELRRAHGIPEKAAKPVKTSKGKKQKPPANDPTPSDEENDGETNS